MPLAIVCALCGVLWPTVFAYAAGDLDEAREVLRGVEKKEFMSAQMDARRGNIRLSQNRIIALTESAARSTGIDSLLLQAMIDCESQGFVFAISSQGEKGLMQLSDEVLRALKISEPYDPTSNVLGGARYLRYLLNRFQNLELSLAAYDAGIEIVEQYGKIPPLFATKQYVRDVMKKYSTLLAAKTKAHRDHARERRSIVFN